jgi:uncharacterized protein (DUF302 family)
VKYLNKILAGIGGFVIVLFLFMYVAFDLGTRIEQAGKLDPKAMSLYMAMGDSVLTTGNAAESMVRKVKVLKGITAEEVVESLNSIAQENNLLVVAESFMSGGKKGGKYITIISYCNPNIAKQFIDFSMSFIAFMPCRMGIVEDDNGDLWIYTMDLGLMISGGHTLPPKMLVMAKMIETTMYKMMDKAAAGDF